MNLRQRIFPTKTRADEAGGRLARAWIDRRGDDEQFQPRRKRKRGLQVAGECALTIEQAAERLDVTPDALKRWLRGQLEGLGSGR